MLETKFIELILRGLPETFIVILLSHLLLRKPIYRKNCLISSILLTSLGFLVRLLPIHYGVHIVLNVFIYILILVNTLNFSLNEAVSASIITFILQLTSEAANIFLITTFISPNLDLNNLGPICKTLYGLPSLIIMIILTSLYYFHSKKRKVL
ncbi:hypothetical protein [Clostridium hydrogeniformans]|uniref:hypothetical protein n=1 Tax=Clostridium hydrogeniformans TaxID=349933 RepID=UPI00048654E2|nr:hypothetical protein [Clostridium hydrogeniformans]